MEEIAERDLPKIGMRIIFESFYVSPEIQLKSIIRAKYVVANLREILEL